MVGGGRSIDHTTLSTFRKKHPEALKNLFVQIGLVARELGHVTLSQLAFDGTQMKANSRRSGTRKVEDLAAERKELAEKFAQLQAQAEAQDAADDDAERLVGQANADQLDAATIAKQLAKMQRQLAALDGALAEIERVKKAGETVPKHIPLTDPEARVTLNKDGRLCSELYATGHGRCGQWNDRSLRCHRHDERGASPRSAGRSGAAELRSGTAGERGLGRHAITHGSQLARP